MGGSSSVPTTIVPATVATTTAGPIPILWGIEPSTQVGTPWILEDDSCQLAINVIFWISFVKCLLSVIAGIIIRACRSSNGYKAGSDGESDGTPWGWIFLSFKFIPWLSILAILLNWQEMLRAFCIISIMILVTGFINILIRVQVCDAVSIIIIVVGMTLQIPSIVHAWPYAFPAKNTEEINLEKYIWTNIQE